MIFGPEVLQMVALIGSGELLSTYAVAKQYNFDAFGNVMREVIIIFLVTSMPQLIYLITQGYLTKIILLFTLFATTVILHLSILARSPKDYANIFLSATIGFVVGAIIFVWGIITAFVLWILLKFVDVSVEAPSGEYAVTLKLKPKILKFFKMRVEVPSIEKILAYLRPPIVIGLFLLNFVVSIVLLMGWI